MKNLTTYRDAVLEIKNAILQSRYQAARLVNREQLTLYYSIGWFVSENTRSGKWGTGAIEEISKRHLPSGVFETAGRTRRSAPTSSPVAVVIYPVIR